MKDVNVYKVFLHEGKSRIKNCSFGSIKRVDDCCFQDCYVPFCSLCLTQWFTLKNLRGATLWVPCLFWTKNARHFHYPLWTLLRGSHPMPFKETSPAWSQLMCERMTDWSKHNEKNRNILLFSTRRVLQINFMASCEMICSFHVIIWGDFTALPHCLHG